MAKQTTKQTSTTKKATKKETKPEVATEVIETEENIVESTEEESEKMIIDSEEVGMEELGAEAPETTEPETTEPKPEEFKVENADDPDFNAVEEEFAEKREDLDIIKIDHNDEPEKKNVFVAKPLCAGNRYHQKVIVKKYPK